MARLGLRHAALGALELLLDVGGGAADLLVGPLEQLGERQLDVRATRSTSVRRSLRASSRNGASACSCSQAVASGSGATVGSSAGGVGGREVAEQAGLLEPGLAVLGDLDGEEPLVDDLPEPVHDARPVEVDARRALVLERVEAGALAEDVQRLRVACAGGSPRTAGGRA